MEAGAGLVAGSHNRNELVIIRREDDVRKALQQKVSRQRICQICGDDVGFTADGEIFVACNDCAFPICRTCYEYERREGNQLCPQCKTRFKRLKGCARVKGDEEEDDIDDVDNEFNFYHHALTEAGFHQGHGRNMSNGSSYESNMYSPPPQVPLLTNGQMVDHIPADQHALVPSCMNSGGKSINTLPFSYHITPVQPRSMDPSKDLAAYGYGSVAWKERMESWKQKQVQVINSENGGRDWDDDEDGHDLPS